MTGDERVEFAYEEVQGALASFVLQPAAKQTNLIVRAAFSGKWRRGGGLIKPLAVPDDFIMDAARLMNFHAAAPAQKCTILNPSIRLSSFFSTLQTGFLLRRRRPSTRTSSQLKHFRSAGKQPISRRSGEKEVGGINSAAQEVTESFAPANDASRVIPTALRVGFLQDGRWVLETAVRLCSPTQRSDTHPSLL